MKQSLKLLTLFVAGALAVGLIVWMVLPSPKLAGLSHNATETFSAALSLITNEIQNGDEIVQWKECTIANGGRQCVVMTNSSGGNIYVDYSQLGTGGKATTSPSFGLLATTTKTISSNYDFTSTLPETASSTLLHNISFATSSPATTTSSMLVANADLARELTVRNGESIILFQYLAADKCRNTGTFLACAAATSSANNALDAFAKVRYHR